MGPPITEVARNQIPVKEVVRVKAMAYRMMMTFVEVVFGAVVGQAVLRRVAAYIHAAMRRMLW